MWALAEVFPSLLFPSFPRSREYLERESDMHSTPILRDRKRCNPFGDEMESTKAPKRRKKVRVNLPEPNRYVITYFQLLSVKLRKVSPLDDMSALSKIMSSARGLVGKAEDVTSPPLIERTTSARLPHAGMSVLTPPTTTASAEDDVDMMMTPSQVCHVCSGNRR